MHTATYTATEIADWFLANVNREVGDAITYLKLQKLIYYSQAWFLVLYQEPLFEEDFQAWVRGPSLPSLHERFGAEQWSALPPPDRPVNQAINDDKRVNQLLSDIFESYGKLQAQQLEELTCSETPWIEAREDLKDGMRCDSIIDKGTIQGYYAAKYEKAKHRARS